MYIYCRHLLTLLCSYLFLQEDIEAQLLEILLKYTQLEYTVKEVFDPKSRDIKAYDYTLCMCCFFFFIQVTRGICFVFF